jgi:glucan phosphoethanolaminetransferase (alkaline phosphatase superfamily)
MWLVFCLSYFKKAIRIFLVIFVLGQGLIPLSKIYPFITLYRLLFYPIFLVWIIRLFSKKNRIIHTPLNGPILLFISIQVIAIIFSFDIGESVKRLPVNIEYYGLLFILISSISNKRDIKKIIGSWLALVFISFISAMYEIATRSNILA